MSLASSDISLQFQQNFMQDVGAHFKIKLFLVTKIELWLRLDVRHY